MRLAALGGAIAFCLVAGCTRASATDWPAIDPGSYQFLSENDGIRFYARTEASGGHPQVRLRMEYRKPTVREGLKTASALILTEFDCARGMSRDLEISGFPRNNMKGDPQTLRPELDWSPVDMDAAIGTLFKIACPKPAA